LQRSENWVYMEVAVITSVSRILIVSSLLVAGCSEAINYSADAQRQGIVLYNRGEYADAAGSFRNAVRRDPRDYKSYYYLGSSYEQLNQHQQALQAYKSSLEIATRTLAGRADDDFRVRTYNSLAGLIAKSDDQGAEATAAQQKAQASQKGEDYYLVAKINQFRGDPDSALDAFNRAAILDPQAFFIAKDYGLYLIQLNQADNAQRQLRRAYSLKSDDAQVNAALAQLGVVPGPGLKDESQLAKPAIPQGPLPEVNLAKLKVLVGAGDSTPAAAPPSVPADQPIPKD
jgi:Tfp pilus assembly protein PilF